MVYNTVLQLRSVYEIVIEKREASAARVPSVPVGLAVLFTRYDVEKAVVMNPSDFQRLSALDRDLAELTAERPPLSDLALKAHALEDQPATPIEDADEIKALLGL